MSAIYRWLCERAGVDRIWEALFARKVPHAKGAAAWLYTLGSASLLIFSVQFLTGALLAMSYSPSPDHAYDSVRFIDSQVLLGRLIHGLHHWGATFMVVVVALHLMRTYFMGAYKFPREATWMVGVCLFLLVMGFSFTGYLLPWDQKAFWATVVGSNIAGQTPVVGPYVAKIMLGGDGMGAATLTRFYAIHVLVLPALTAAAIGVHLFLVVWHGISEPPKRAGREETPS
jgi:quinol-cytochrome oxidoreductase complex cytochrome b subunit